MKKIILFSIGLCLCLISCNKDKGLTDAAIDDTTSYDEAFLGRQVIPSSEYSRLGVELENTSETYTLRLVEAERGGGFNRTDDPGAGGIDPCANANCCFTDVARCEYPAPIFGFNFAGCVADKITVLIPWLQEKVEMENTQVQIVARLLVDGGQIGSLAVSCFNPFTCTFIDPIPGMCLIFDLGYCPHSVEVITSFSVYSDACDTFEGVCGTRSHHFYYRGDSRICTPF